MIKDLELIGMHKNQATVYEMLVQYGPCKAGLLINKLDIHRNLVYQSLDSLVLKGYATKFIKKGVWHFQITDPHSLLTQVRQHEVVLQELVKKINTVKHKSDQQIVVYEGEESYRNFWMKTVESVPVGTIDYVVGSAPIDKWIKIMGPLHEKYQELRIKKKHIWKVIQFEISETDKKLLREYPEVMDYRLWPRDSECLGNFNIIHDTVILHSMADPPRIIEIRDPSFVLIFKNYFDMMWEKSKEIKI